MIAEATQGWVSESEAVVLRPPHGRFIEAHIRLPEGTPVTRQTLTFRINGELIGRVSFECGDYTIPLAIPEPYSGASIVLTIQAARFFLSEQQKKLSYILDRVGYAE